MPTWEEWEDRVSECIADGGRRHTPNGLPVRCIRFDGLCLECEHGDHGTYMFPVIVEGENDQSDADQGFYKYPETQALIYTDGVIALTMYEANYAIWSVRTGEPLGGRYQYPCERLSEESRKKIAALGRVADVP